MLISSQKRQSAARSTVLAAAIALMLCTAPTSLRLHAQESLYSGAVMPMGEWLAFKQTRFNGAPILLHLRTGYERAVLMPEVIRLENPDQLLPGCEIYIDTDVIGFYPTQEFQRKPVRFVGVDSGTIYELRVRASASGMRQPLQVMR